MSCIYISWRVVGSGTEDADWLKFVCPRLRLLRTVLDDVDSTHRVFLNFALSRFLLDSPFAFILSAFFASVCSFLLKYALYSPPQLSPPHHDEYHSFQQRFFS